VAAGRTDVRRPVASKARFREFESAAMSLSARLLRTAADAAEGDPEESGIFLRTVRDLRRIHSHLASFAYPILHGERGGKVPPADEELSLTASSTLE
jgi:phosphate:Na+ symporter